MSAVIRVERLNKTFGHKQALFDLALSVEPGEMVALIGASGSGNQPCCAMSRPACCDRTAAAAFRYWAATCRLKAD